MLDFRVETFLTLCEEMNYTRAAERLSVTQPAVTGHIRWLEDRYGCRLFSYSGKTLSLTGKGAALRRFAQSMRANDRKIDQEMHRIDGQLPDLRVGATKTIGEYVIPPKIARYIANGCGNLNLTVDNTQTLLRRLDRGELDFALVEGYFDKSRYGWRLYRTEKFIGVCGAENPLAGHTICFEDLLRERLIVREHGSGTRAVLSQLLREKNYAAASFASVTEINNFAAIKRLLAEGLGVSFMYESAAADGIADGSLARLELADTETVREFNYVYPADTLFLEQYEAFFNA